VTDTKECHLILTYLKTPLSGFSPFNVSVITNLYLELHIQKVTHNPSTL
jgi:hypothetical protein